jgi:hypothetical protein
MATEDTVHVLIVAGTKIANVRVWSEDVLSACRSLAELIIPGAQILAYGHDRPWRWSKPT